MVTKASELLLMSAGVIHHTLKGARHFEDHLPIVARDTVWSDLPDVAWCLTQLQVTDPQVWSDSRMDWDLILIIRLRLH